MWIDLAKAKRRRKEKNLVGCAPFSLWWSVCVHLGVTHCIGLLGVSLEQPPTAMSWLEDYVKAFAEGTLTFETSRPTWVSVQDVVLNKTKDRPRNQVNRSQSSATFTTHTQATERDVSAHVAMVFVDVSLLDTKQMRSRLLTSFCQLHKSDQNTCRHKKSLHQDMVCLFK